MTDKRVRTGCATCRRRRIKCDETKPICNRCRNANFQCEGYAAPRRLSNTSSASRSVLSKRSTSSASPPSSSPSQWSTSNSASPPDTSSFPEISLRHKDWRREQLPLYHHFVTTTVVRLFRQDHVEFWRDEVVQMSHGMDLVYEALLAVGAIHRSSLITCQAGNGPQALRFKLFGFRSYGKVMQMLPKHLSLTSVPDIFASLVVLMLLAYFECFLENPKAAFRHLWAAILLFRSSEERFSEEEMSSAIPIFDAMLRLDFLAQTLVPYAGSSFLRISKQAIMESPFWNRPDPKFSGCTQLDAVAAERYRLLQLVGAHNKLTRIVWGCLFPPNEWPSREEMRGFHDEMLLWKATSPATFRTYDASDEIGHFDALALNTASALHIAVPSNFSQAASLSDPQPQFFASNEAALNAALCNDYLISALSMLSSCDKDPIARELEAYSLVYQNLCIAAGLIERHKYWANAKTPYKPCDAVSMGITTLLFHGARRCYSRGWQKWTISALRKIGREGLSNGHTCANAVEILLDLQDEPQQGNMDTDDEYLGPLRDRVMPLLMPRGEEDLHLAFYLRHGQIILGEDEGTIQVLAKATWRQESDGTMHSLQLDRYDSLSSFERPKARDLFESWRPEVGNGWHGYLSNEIQDGFLRKECPLSSF